jgi:hypothetical protein
LFLAFEQPSSSIDPAWPPETASTRPVTYLDGLYYALVTPIGEQAQLSGPQSAYGRLLNRVAGVTKLLTAGTLSGFFHQGILIRRLQETARQQVIRCRRLTEDTPIAWQVGALSNDDPSLTARYQGPN